MNMRKVIKGVGLLAGALLLFTSGGAYAAGTAAGTTVTNQVDLSFNVNGTPQSPQQASVDFKVDDKLVIDVANQDGGDVTTNTEPGSQKAVSVFQVTNNGNAAQDVILSAVNMASGTTDPYNTGVNSDFPIATSGVYSDSNCTTSISTISNLAAGAQKTVYVCSTIPQSATNNQVAVVGLLAKVGAAGSGSAYASDDKTKDKNTTGASGNLNKQLNIFAEAASTHPATGDGGADDGASSDLGAYKVQAAVLSITKAVSVISDPTNDSNPHAIPGAIVEYTVTIDNGNGQTASGLDVTDSISSDLAYQGNMMVTLPGGTSKSCDGTPSSPATFTLGSNTVTCQYDASHTPEPQIEVSGFSVPANGKAVITYQAKIN